MSGDAIGMMEGAFFVSKGVILDWLNELLDVSFFIIITFSVASTYQNRTMCNRLSLLPSDGRHLPGVIQSSKS
jgi:hypothetical protein